MQTKSNIQLIREALAVKESFQLSLGNIVERYLVKDSVFSFDGVNVNETVDGYFSIKGEYKTLNEAFDNLTLGDQIRVINNESYQVGKVYQKLSEAKSDKVYDIRSGKMVGDSE